MSYEFGAMRVAWTAGEGLAQRAVEPGDEQLIADQLLIPALSPERRVITSLVTAGSGSNTRKWRERVSGGMAATGELSHRGERRTKGPGRALQVVWGGACL